LKIKFPTTLLKELRRASVKTGIEEKNKKKIIALISALVPTAKIYLFGSRARGTHSKSSDIDIAIDAGERLPILAVGEIIDVLAGTDIMLKIDVVDVHEVSEIMQKSIMDEAIVWKN